LKLLEVDLIERLVSVNTKMTDSMPHDESTADKRVRTSGNGNPGRFRTVLPHEPLPGGTKGIIHLQGAFEPKQKHRPVVEGSPASPFWTKDTLEEALLSLSSREELGFSHPVQQVHILDATAPFTKVQLVYDSPLAAGHVQNSLRRLELTPAQLFKEYTTSEHTFGSRAFQATHITDTELPPIDTAWNRSSPPKFRRLIGRPGEAMAVLEQERETTRFVFVSNVLDPEHPMPLFWNDAHCVMEAIRSVVNGFDSSRIGAEVFVSQKKIAQYCYVGMRSAADAQRLIGALQDTRVSWQWTSLDGEVQTVASGNLYLDYASITQRSKALTSGEGTAKGESPRSECTSLTEHVTVPGLVLVPDFVSEAEEKVLMAVLTGPQAPWAPSQSTPSNVGVVKRRVQHYGYVFDYQTANVLRDRSQEGANCPPIPALPEEIQEHSQLEDYMKECVDEGRGWEALASVVEKTRQHEFTDKPTDGHRTFTDLNQITLNKYDPGDGIGSHVDTPSAFGDGLISISLNGGIVMEFRKVGGEGEGSKKLVYLPPRSLLLMSGPARYEWEHMIVTRTTDTHNGIVIPRSLRISLTMRTALDLEGLPMPRVESTTFPPTWGVKGADQALTSLATPDCERDHVHAVYDAIATQWHHTRGRRGVLWPGATQFLQLLPAGSIVADVGCGDGKYFPAIWEAGSYVIGTDMSLPLLKTALQAGAQNDDVPESRRVSDFRRHLNDRPAMAVADCMSTPLRSKSCDAAICIAVLHHLSTASRRRRCIEELARIVRPGGTINIQAWALEQEEGSKRRFAANDVFVPFNAQPKYLQLNKSGSGDAKAEGSQENAKAESKSMAQVYSNAFNAEFDDRKGLVVFKRYCHLYRKGELEQLASEVPGVAVLESGYESGNYFLILKVLE
jgi:alkylated DNA repair dioxygenase AlkB/SAM-dependent methyltransferase